MRSEVISKPVLTEVDDKEMILYWPYRKTNSYVIFSSEGILYQENWYSHFTVNPYVSLIESLRKNKKIFAKSAEGLDEFLFEFNKIYVYLDDTHQSCEIFSFNRSIDSDPIFTIINLKELATIEKTNMILSYDLLKDFLYEIEDPCDEEFFDKELIEDSIIGKFIFSTVIRYANLASSDLVYKTNFDEVSRAYIMQEIKHLESTKAALEARKNDFYEDAGEVNGERISSESDGLAERIIHNLKEACNTDSEEDEFFEIIPTKEEISSKENEEDPDRLFALVSGDKNFRVVIKYNGEIEIGKFSIYCLGEDSFELEYEKLHIGKMDEIKEIFSVLKVK